MTQEVHLGPVIEKLRKGVCRRVTTGRPAVVVDIEETERFMASVADILSLVIRARSSAPEAREGEAVAWLYETVSGTKTASVEPLSRINGDKVYGTALYTHPAAPSADKLREVLIDLTSWFTKPVQGRNGMVWVIPAGEMGADDALNAALAALKDGDQ